MQPVELTSGGGGEREQLDQPVIFSTGAATWASIGRAKLTQEASTIEVRRVGTVFTRWSPLLAIHVISMICVPERKVWNCYLVIGNS